MATLGLHYLGEEKKFTSYFLRKIIKFNKLIEENAALNVFKPL